MIEKIVFGVFLIIISIDIGTLNYTLGGLLFLVGLGVLIQGLIIKGDTSD